MAVPTAFSDLSTTAASNQPDGTTEAANTVDNHLRQIYAFLRSLYEGNSGGQIGFPAIQNASSNANTLDDYEEGSWTPAISFGGATTGITYTSQVGKYIKIGKEVYVSARIQLSSNGSATGAFLITGLPFTAVNSEARGCGTVGYYDGLASITGTPSVMAVNNTTTAQVRIPGATQATSLTDANFSAFADFYFTLVYEASA